jgi:hypothetical protein
LTESVQAQLGPQVSRDKKDYTGLLMTKFLFLFSIALLTATLGACSPKPPHGFTGYLYFAQGNYLTRFSLRDGSLSVAANFGDMSIREISAFGENRLFLAGTAAINRRTVPRISWIDLETGEKVAQYSGILARYMANANIIIYDDGIKLYAMPQGSGGAPDEIIYAHGLNRITTVLEVSNDTLLFETGEPGQRVIRAWDAVTGQQRVLDELTAACELVGSVWLESHQQLACRKRDSTIEASEYVLVNLDGQVVGRLALPEGGRFTALTYIPGQSALVMKENWTGAISDQEKSAVWIHNVRTGENTRLSKHQNLGSSVVFTQI